MAKKKLMAGAGAAAAVPTADLVCIPSKIKWDGADKDIRVQAKDPIFDAQFDWHIVIADLSMVRAPKKRCLPITYSSTSELVIKGYEIALNAPAGPRTVRIYRSPKGQDISYCDAGGASPCPNNCAGNCICDPNFHVYNSKGQPLEILA